MIKPPDRTADADASQDTEMPQINLDNILREISQTDESNGFPVEIRVLNDPDLGSKVHARIGAQLARASDTKEQLSIRIPADVIGISPKFLEKMFEGSLDKIESLEAFRKIFRISASIEVSVQVFRAIEALILNRRKAA